MCNHNSNIKRLKELRAKGHVLKRFYKLVRLLNSGVCSQHQIHTWETGWNHAINHHTKRKMTKKSMHRFGEKVYSQIHMFRTKPCFLATPSPSFAVMTVYAYCDEITAYDAMSITASRVLVKRLPSVHSNKT